MKRILFLGLILFLLACEPDDICSDSTQTTSPLVIEFFNIENISDTKTVPGLFAIGVDAEGNEVVVDGEVVSSRNKIALPLDVSQNQTQFKLYQNYSVADGIVQGNPDTITITYTSESVYVSKACGYKNVFTIQSFEIQSDLDLWMIVSSIAINEVANENETHVEILH